MKNILKIFIDDVKRIRKNVIAMIVVIGVLVVPCLYAWFNIAADAVLSVLHLQSAFCGVYPACHVPAGKRVADR